MIDENEKTTEQTLKAAMAKEHSVSSNPISAQFGYMPGWAWVHEGWLRLRSKRRLDSHPIAIAILGIFISAIVGFSAGWVGEARHNSSASGILTGSTSPQKEIVTSQSQLINSIARTVGPSVVSVNVTSTSQSLGGFFNFGGLPQSEQSAGTGIILTANGLVITNRHVVPQGTTSVSVTLSDGTELKDVSVLGRTNPNDSLDVAFLKINKTEGKTLTPAILGDSSAVQVGDAVVAIGNALGQFQNTVTSGIVSGYGRSVQASSSNGSQSTENLNDLFQTDAAINEGNSGGPLVNMNGQVVGINTAIAGGAQNIGFAIPINDVIGLIKQIQSTGKLQQPYLGVYYIPVTADVAQQYNLSVQRGAWVPPASVLGQSPVISGGPADQAGLLEGDIVTKVDGTTIDQNNSLTSIIDKDQVGQTVNLTVVRGGKTISVKVTLAAAPTS